MMGDLFQRLARGPDVWVEDPKVWLALSIVVLVVTVVVVSGCVAPGAGGSNDSSGPQLVEVGPEGRVETRSESKTNNTTAYASVNELLGEVRAVTSRLQAVLEVVAEVNANAEVSAQAAAVASSTDSHDRVGGDLNEGSQSSARGDGAQSLSLVGSGGPLLVAVVAFLAALCFVAYTALRFWSHSRKQRYALSKLMTAVEREDAGSVKQRFCEMVDDTKTQKIVDDILNKEVRPGLFGRNGG